MFWSADRKYHDYFWRGDQLDHGVSLLRSRQELCDAAHVIRFTTGPQGLERFTRGAAADSDRVRLAVRHLLQLTPLLPLKTAVPQIIRSDLAEAIRRATQHTQSQYGTFGSEEHQTGSLFDRVSSTWTSGGWTVTVRQQQYSKNVKEKLIGADAGVVVEVRDHLGRGIRKAAWLQAKRVRALASRPPDDAELRRQVGDMRRHTSAAYAILYAANGTEVRGGDNLLQHWTFDDWLDGIVRCERGDTNDDVIIDTFDRSRLLTVVIVES